MRDSSPRKPLSGSSDKLASGSGFFTSEEARGALGLSDAAFAASALRFIKNDKLAHPRRGFYLILRPQD